MESSSYTILYIEDNELNMALMQHIFKKIPQVDLIGVPNAEEGIELAVSTQPDMILMDIQLPGIDGYQALKLLRERQETRDIPVLAISSYAQKGDVEKGKQAGFAHYITKPIQVKAFKELIEQSLALKKLF
ncbi:response regulator [Paenibacillus sp. J22TS3]|uniref:response regulator n=1 Tax=Paenibacillus sp. J22TS3 TaxID=2807192 RepID=UPI001B21C154|nr:response regulator [Paenibacillus sp. J22TS3]GIP22671.1 response regulator [Paenibacillus sp. J22TS3]